MTEKESLNTVLELLGIRGPSGEEKQVMEYLRQRLKDEGLPANTAVFDTARKRIPLPTQTGNLIVTIPGKGEAKKSPRRLFAAHTDTVELAAGTVPKRKRKRILPSKDRALGADDRAGVAAVLLMLLRVLKEDPVRPPLTALFTVREETGLWGARMVDVGKLRQPQMGFSYDGDRIDTFNIAAPGSDRMDITVSGIASHAGGSPEKGVSAAVVSSLAIAELQEKGLHGLIKEGGDRATSNIGSIEGGIFHNIVCPQVGITAEARAYRLSTLNRVVSSWRKAFRSALKKVKNSSGRKGSLDFQTTRLYHPFVLSRRSPVVRFTGRVVRAAGMEPAPEWSQGGLDANWLVRHGIPTVTLGAGAHGAHTTYESLDIDEFHQGVEAAWLLATTA